jgi:hypothetical protein
MSPPFATGFHAGFLLGLFFNPEDGATFFQNVGLRGVMSQKTEFFNFISQNSKLNKIF